MAPLQHQDHVLAAAFSPDGSGLVTVSRDRSARLCKAPRPVQGTPAHSLLWCDARTGLALDEHGVVHALDVKTWRERRARLPKLRGRRSSTVMNETGHDADDYNGCVKLLRYPRSVERSTLFGGRG